MQNLSLCGDVYVLPSQQQGDGVQPETHSLFQRGLLASANPALDPGLQRAIDAGWMENVKMGARTPPQAAPRARTVRAMGWSGRFSTRCCEQKV